MLYMDGSGMTASGSAASSMQQQQQQPQPQQEDLFIDDLDGIFDDGPMSADDLTLDTDEGLDFDDDNDNVAGSEEGGATDHPMNDHDFQPTPISSMMRGTNLPGNINNNGVRRSQSVAVVSNTVKNAAAAGGTGVGLSALPHPTTANPLPALQRSSSEPVRTTTTNDNNNTIPKAPTTTTTKRTEKHIEGKGCPLPPPSWHSDAADRPHRQAMVIEIARLLQTRKRSVPSSDWLRQLPHKARKLEERLYRNASSLEAYLDKATLKTRLKKLANVITRQFEEAKRQHGGGGGANRSRSSESSSMSMSTTSSLASFASSAAAASLRDSFTSVNSMDSTRSLQELARRNSIPTHPTTSSNSPNAFDRRSSGRFTLTNPLHVLPEVPFSEGPESSSGSSSGGSAAGASHDRIPVPQQHSQAPPPPGGAAAVTPGTDNLAEIERQRSVNANLQQQIMENIRQQEELVRRMQGHPGGNANPNNPPTPNLPGNQPPNLSNAGSFVHMNLSGGMNAPMSGNPQQFQGMNQVRGNSMGMNANLQMNPALMAAMFGNRQFQPNGPLGSASLGGAPNNNSNNNAMLSNPLIANLNNQHMLQQAFAQASSQGVTGGGVQQPHQQLQQQQLQQQQFAFLQGTPMMPDPSFMAAATAAAGVLSGGPSNYSPILPNGVAGNAAAMSGGHGALMPPPNVSSPRNSNNAQGSLQDAARVAKNGFGDDSEPLSPGSFNW